METNNASSTQACVSNKTNANRATIPTTPVVTTVPHSQVQTVVSQPVQIGPATSQPQVSGQEAQVSQVVVQQSLVFGVQQQPQVSIPLSILTQTYTGIVYSQPSQPFIVGQQQPLNQKQFYQKQQQLIQQP